MCMNHKITPCNRPKSRPHDSPQMTTLLSRHIPFMTRSLSLMAAIAMAGCATATSLTPFSTDGCSIFPNRSLTGRTDWCDCCLLHDLAYWRGGTADERLTADQDLRACVAQKTQNQALAETMYLGVRTGGGPDIKSPFRWGYGWPFGRGYQALTEDETASVNAYKEAYLAKNPKLECKADASITQLWMHPPLHRARYSTAPGSSPIDPAR